MSETTSKSGLTQALTDVKTIQENYHLLERQVVELTATNADQADALEKARVAFEEQHAALQEALQREEDATARAGKLAALVDAAAAGQPVERPREPGEHLAGDLVTFTFRDVVTGDQLTGPGVVVRPGEGALVVAPLSPAVLQLPAEAVQHTTVAEVTGEAEPQDEDA